MVERGITPVRLLSASIASTHLPGAAFGMRAHLQFHESKQKLCSSQWFGEANMAAKKKTTVKPAAAKTAKAKKPAGKKK